MSLGVGAYEIGGAGHCSSMRRRYPWQPCKRPPPGTIALCTYLAHPHEEGRDGKNQAQNGSKTAS